MAGIESPVEKVHWRGPNYQLKVLWQESINLSKVNPQEENHQSKNYKSTLTVIESPFEVRWQVTNHLFK